MPSAQLVLSVGRWCSLWPDIAPITQCSRDLAADVILQTALLLPAVTETDSATLHLTLVDDSFLELDGFQDHVLDIVDVD